MNLDLTETQTFLLAAALLVIIIAYGTHIVLRNIQDQRLKQVLCKLGANEWFSEEQLAQEGVCSLKAARSFLRRQRRRGAIEMGYKHVAYRLTNRGRRRYDNEIRIRGGYPVRA
jgi:hypothetical protein